mgnify:CR=1 FL=1
MTQSEAEFNKLFDSIDTDRSGTIEFDEFVDALNRVISTSPKDVSASVEVGLVQLTFQRLANDDSGPNVFYELLLADPSSKSILRDLKLERQSRMIFRMLGNAIQGLTRPESAKAVLTKMGKRHLDFGVGPQNYSAVRVAMFGALEQVLGGEFKPYVRQAWEKQFRIVEDALNQGVYEVAKSKL